MPQSEPSRRDEALGLAQVGGEDRRRQALRHGVVQRDRLVEVVGTHHVEDRREGLAQHRPGLRRHLDERRARHRTPSRHAAACSRSPPVHLAAGGARLVQRPLHAVEGGLVDQRADQRRRPRADRRPARCA